MGTPTRKPEDPTLLTDEAPDAPGAVILAHGAGAPMDSPFMNTMAAEIRDRGVTVVRFEFPYMAGRRVDGRRRGPDRPAVLTATWERAVELVAARVGGSGRVVVGGKSMGGRIASMVADDAGVAGVVCLGYPFHPPGNPTKLRTAHLETLRTPALILQGERDPFGTPPEIASYPLSKRITVEYFEDGDHSLKPRKSSGHTEAGHLSRAAERIATFAIGRVSD